MSGAEVRRCAWANNPINVAYHDQEWGVPQHDDRVLFEFLILEGAQAGLSWDTILKKRDGYRRVFDGFDPAVVATYDDVKEAALMQDAGIIRNRLKIRSAIGNAQAFLRVQAEFGSFDAYVWGFVDGKTVTNPWHHTERLTRTAQSDALSKDLLRRGFKFVGTTICHAYMQAVGMVNDHEKTCFRYRQIAGREARLTSKNRSRL